MNGGGFKENTSKTDLYFYRHSSWWVYTQQRWYYHSTYRAIAWIVGNNCTYSRKWQVYSKSGCSPCKMQRGLLDPNFCYYLISSSIVRQQLSAAAQQTKIRHTSPEKIKDCTVWVPDFEVQKNIGRILTDIDNKIAINRRINDNLLLLDHSLRSRSSSRCLVNSIISQRFSMISANIESNLFLKSIFGQTNTNNSLQIFVWKVSDGRTLLLSTL